MKVSPDDLKGAGTSLACFLWYLLFRHCSDLLSS